MSHIVSLVNAFAAVWADALFRACWQGGLGIMLVWLLCRLWPALPAGPRCWLWRLAYAKLLLGLVWLPPLALPLLPAPKPPPAPPVAQADAPLAQAPPPTVPPVQALPDDALPLAAVPPPLPATPSAPLTAPPPAPAAAPLSPPAATPALPPRPTLPTVQTWLLAAWLMGVFASLSRVAAAWRRACAFSRAGRPLADEGLQTDAADLSQRLGLRRVPPLHVAGGLASPLLLGLGRPAILLPAFVVSGSPRPELRLMLAHELAHLARRDLLWNVLPQTAQRLFFFHPLVWLAGHEWALAQEIACDALAVQTTGTPPSAYARMLLSIATRRRPSAAPLFPTLAVAAPRHTLRRRLHAMQHIRTLSRPRLILAAALTALLAVGGLVPWRVVAQSGAAVSVPPTTSQEDAAQGDAPWQDQERRRQVDIAVKNAQLDAQLAEVENHLPAKQSKTALAYIRWINADYASNQLAVQLTEQQRADYVATHPNSLTDAQIALVQKVIISKLNHKRISKDVQAKLDAIPTKQRDRVEWLRYCDLNISSARMRAFVQKQANVFQLRTEYGSTKQRRAGVLPTQGQSQGATATASLMPHASATFSTALAVGVPPPPRAVDQAGPALPLPAAIWEEEAHRMKERADFAAWEAQADAQFAEALRHVPPARQKEVQARIAGMDEYVAKSQKHTLMMEQHRADYIATHPYRLSNAQRNDITRLLDLNIRRNGLNQNVAMGHILRVKLLADVAAAKDAASRESYRAQIERDDARRRAAEQEMRLLEPRIARQKAIVALIPEDQRTLMDKLRHYDIDVWCGRIEALTIKRGRIQVLQQVLAAKPPRQHPGTSTKASFAPPEAKTASFDAVAVGGPPALRLAQAGASLSTPPAVTQKEEASQEKSAAEFASRGVQLDAQLAAILKPLSPEQRKKAEASVAFLDAGDAKTRQHIRMLEQHRADYLALHPNRLSDAQVALVQKFNWDKMDPYRIDEGIRWEQSIKRKLQTHIDSSQDARSRQGWQRQIAAIEQRRQAAQRQIRELGPAIAREEAEVAAIPEDQRVRVAKLRSYDSEISAYKNIALMDKQMRIAILRQQIAGTLHGGRHGQGAKTGTSLTPLDQVGMNETQPSHTTGQSILVISRQNTAPDTGLLPLPFQMFAPPARPNPLFNVNWRLADLARRLSDLRRGSSLELALKRIAILGGREDGGLQTIPATRYYFSPGVIIEIPAKDGVITGPLRIHPGGFDYD